MTQGHDDTESQTNSFQDKKSSFLHSKGIGSPSPANSDSSKLEATFWASDAPTHTHSLYNSLFRQDGFSLPCLIPPLALRNIVLPHRTPMGCSLVWFKDNSSIIRGYSIVLG